MKDLSKMTPRELLDIYECTKEVYLYYDNLAKANNGQYDKYAMQEYNSAMTMLNRYNKIREDVFLAIKNKVDEIYQ